MGQKMLCKVFKLTSKAELLRNHSLEPKDRTFHFQEVGVILHTKRFHAVIACACVLHCFKHFKPIFYTLRFIMHSVTQTAKISQVKIHLRGVKKRKNWVFILGEQTNNISPWSSETS